MPAFSNYKLKIISLATLVLLGYANITRAQSYVLADYSWVSAAADIYVDFDITNSTSYNPPNTVTSGPTNADFNNAYIQAMNEWNSASVFQWFANTSGSDIDPCAGNHSGVKFSLETCDGAFGSATLAIQLTTYGAGNLANNTVTVFNNNKLWNIYNGSGSGFDFRRVAVHELGHGLGLDHADFGNIMYFQSNSTQVPQSGDINGVTAKYGSGGGNDVDGDGISNSSDNCPLDTNNNQLDSDSDGTGNVCDLDSDTNDLDADGVINNADNCPIDPNFEQDDLDSDNIGDACDDDIDGDLIDNNIDNCPTDTNSDQSDIDSDSIGDVCDSDADGDGVFNGPAPDVSHEYTTGPVSGSLYSAGPNSSNSSFPFFAQTFQVQNSGNLTRVDLPINCPSGGIDLQIRPLSGNQPSNTILSSTLFAANGGTLPVSNAGFVELNLAIPLGITVGINYAIVVDVASECWLFSATSNYASGEGYLGTNSNFWSGTGDYRFRTWVDPVPGDNCPLDANPSQADQDNDGVGDACEIADQDHDGVQDSSDNCPAIANPLQENFDGDSEGDACDSDDDNDGLSDADELAIYGTDPFNSDTDDDGYSDGFEVSVGTNPNLPEVNIPVLPAPALLLLWIAISSVALLLRRPIHSRP